MARVLPVTKLKPNIGDNALAMLRTRSQSKFVRGQSELYPNIMGPPGILGLFILGIM